MAQDDSTTPRKAKGTSPAAWVLIILLVAGLGGFGVTSFGGNVQSIGKVGDRSIDVNTYARALRQQLDTIARQFGQAFTLAQAQAMGIDRQVLQSVLDQAALDNEADRIGLSVGDAVVAAELTAMPAFLGTAGTFDRNTYRQTLEQNGLTESDFETTMRDDLARSILQGAVVGGFAAPKILTDTLWAYTGEQRSFTLLPITEADLPTPLAAPTEADLTAFYTANLATFTRGEAKRISYVALLPDEVALSMPVDEAVLRKAYQDRISEFVIPERRLVERLVYPDAAAATAARARLDAGTPFETLVADRGLTLADVDLGDVSKSDLGPAGEAVFTLAGPGVVGPFDSDLGPALFRMNAVLSAQETTFDAARPALATELQTEAARQDIGNKVEAVNDLLAGGGTLEDLVAEQGMTLATTDYVGGAADNDAIAGYPAFRTAADALAVGDFPEAILLDDGGLVALRLDEMLPPTPIPLDTIQDRVTEAWRAQALAAALSAQAVAIKSAVESGAALETLGTATVTEGIDRQGTVEGAPPEVLQAVFKMAAGDLRVIEAAGYTALVRLDKIMAAPAGGDDAKAMQEAIRIEVERTFAQDAFTLYTGALSAAAGITLDQAAINAVNAQLQ